MEIRELNEEIQQLMMIYYKEYYHDLLGLPDWAERIQSRFEEEELIGKPNIIMLEKILHYKFDSSKKVLVIGGGTGAEFFEFVKSGCDVYTIEPNDTAIKIMKLKCQKYNIDENKICQGVAESLPFKDNLFDFVYCFTVLEHVQDVNKTIQEAIRVTKPGGYMHFKTPDFRQFYEEHYKIHIPLWLPIWILKLILWFIGRPTAFLNTLNFVTAKQLRNIFRRSQVIAMQIYFPYQEHLIHPKGWDKLIIWMQDVLGIERSQYWVLIKEN